MFARTLQNACFDLQSVGLGRHTDARSGIRPVSSAQTADDGHNCQYEEDAGDKAPDYVEEFGVAQRAVGALRSF